MSPLPFKLAAVDLDGTLLATDKTISDENLKAIRRLEEAGLIVLIASGREHLNCIRYHRQLELTSPIVSFQGALVKHPDTGEVLMSCGLDDDLANEILEQSLLFETNVLYGSEKGVYATSHNKWTELYERVTGEKAHIVESWNDHDAGTAIKIQWLDEPERVYHMLERLENRILRDCQVWSYDSIAIEFVRQGITKVTGVAAVADHLGIKANEVLTFGDAENDASMLAWAGLGIAMSHSRDAAIKAADIVAPPGHPDSSLARGIDLVFNKFAGTANKST
jgi:Cof subfamily protein (haloacid dehalogenase superfamily)